jgi:membrane associated rhomboid family serine protease
MARYPRYGDVSYTFGPGRITPAVKILLITNVVVFLVSQIVPIVLRLGLAPSMFFEQMALWQPVTYMFLHGGIGHILFNMLSLWMFGTDLEARWGTRFFTKYYFVTGIGAAATTLLWSVMPLPYADAIYYSMTIGASGAIYGVLLAYGMEFPHRTILLLIFPVQARYYVMIAAAIVLLSSIGAGGGGVAHTAHLGGLVVGYFYLKGLRRRPLDELKYRWLRWKMQRARSRFDVHPGGRDDDSWKSDWKKHIH